MPSRKLKKFTTATIQRTASGRASGPRWASSGGGSGRRSRPPTREHDAGPRRQLRRDANAGGQREAVVDQPDHARGRRAPSRTGERAPASRPGPSASGQRAPPARSPMPPAARHDRPRARSAGWGGPAGRSGARALAARASARAPDERERRNARGETRSAVISTIANRGIPQSYGRSGRAPVLSAGTRRRAPGRGTASSSASCRRRGAPDRPSGRRTTRPRTSRPRRGVERRRRTSAR